MQELHRFCARLVDQPAEGLPRLLYQCPSTMSIPTAIAREQRGRAEFIHSLPDSVRHSGQGFLVAVASRIQNYTRPSLAHPGTAAGIHGT